MSKGRETHKLKPPRVHAVSPQRACAVKSLRCKPLTPPVRSCPLARISAVILPARTSSLPESLRERVAGMEAGGHEVVSVFTKLPPKGAAGYTALKNGRLLEVHLLKPVAVSSCRRIGVVVRREAREVLVVLSPTGEEQIN
jgi:hypothetical protein